MCKLGKLTPASVVLVIVLLVVAWYCDRPRADRSGVGAPSSAYVRPPALAAPAPRPPPSPSNPSRQRRPTVAPRPAREPGDLGVMTPGSPDYDPAALASTFHVDSRALFAREPRNETWAREREAAMRADATAFLADQLADLEVEAECRTSACQLTIHTSDDQRLFLLGQLAIAASSIAGQLVREGDRTTFVGIGLFNKDERTPEGYQQAIDAMQRIRADILAELGP